jgi:predicted DNA-binding transcriptional regulator YafY
MQMQPIMTREQAAALLSELKALYNSLPPAHRQAVKDAISSVSKKEAACTLPVAS